MIKQNLEPINIMLADNNPLILSGMSDIFDRDPRFSLVATSATAEGFLGMVMRVPVEIGVIFSGGHVRHCRGIFGHGDAGPG